MRNFSKLIVISITLILIAWGAYSAWMVSFNLKGPLTESKRVLIPAGASVHKIASILEEEGVIDSAFKFRMGVKTSFLETRMKAGEYDFEPAVSARHVMHKITDGQVTNYTLTIPEGLTNKEVFERLEAHPALIGDIPTQIQEGLLYPSTYHVTRGFKRRDVLYMMAADMEKKLKTAWDNRYESEYIKTPEDLRILASIVEKEAVNDAERAEIAGVYLNRLKKGMRLQADPTVIYGIKNYDGDIRSKDLKDKSNPYNTYMFKGLPPTAIANAGFASLMAAAQPAETENLFFVAKVDGTGHDFSRTYAEHNRKVQKLVKHQRTLGR